MRYVLLTGRLLYAQIFIISAFGHFSAETVEYAESQGVPVASLFVPISGIIILLGGLSVALGYRARYGAWLLVIFLIPVTLMMHNFWALTEPGQVQLQTTMFVKNTALLGAALMIAYFGSGPLSLSGESSSRVI